MIYKVHNGKGDFNCYPTYTNGMWCFWYYPDDPFKVYFSRWENESIVIPGKAVEMTLEEAMNLLDDEDC
jgi:hypothetical protein